MTRKKAGGSGAYQCVTLKERVSVYSGLTRIEEQGVKNQKTVLVGLTDVPKGLSISRMIGSYGWEERRFLRQQANQPTSSTVERSGIRVHNKARTCIVTMVLSTSCPNR